VIVAGIDELADLLITGGKAVEGRWCDWRSAAGKRASI
jgi:hypothetical protein